MLRTQIWKKWRWRGGLVFGLLLAIGLGRALASEEALQPASTYVGGRSDGEGLPKLWQLPDFELVSQQRQRVTRESLRGHVAVLSFLFTSCGSVCPTLSARLALLERRLPARELYFVSFSVDPEHDSPERLAAYARGFRPDETRWLLLSTDAPQLARVLRGMHVSIEQTSDAESPIAHSSLLFLSDGDGWVRGVYDSTRDDRERGLGALERDVQALLPTPPAESSLRPGAALYRELGCDGCHQHERLAPPLGHLLGRRVSLDDGRLVSADPDYVRRSIVAPRAELARGYGASMPSYEAELSPAELDALVDYVSRL